MPLLKRKKALITGGTSGLGREIALTFANHGSDVALLGTNPEKAKEVAEKIQIEQNFPDQKVWFDILDVSKKDQVEAGVKRLLEAWDHIDILVNCAGVTRDKFFMRMSEKDWDTVLNVNLKSVFNLCQSLVRPMMKAKRGKIINISSVVGLMGNPGQTNYAASKSGMIGFTRSLAKELAPRNICVNCIAPGLFETPMTDKLGEEIKKGFLSKIPMGRFGNPKEIANAALFLASEMSNYVTGQVLTVDGGMLA